MGKLRTHRLSALALSVTLASAVVTVAPSGASSPTHHHDVVTIKVPTPEVNGFTPKPPAGATDLYRCTFFNPQITQNMMLTGSSFVPQLHNGKIEIHHAILYLVNPDYVALARAMDNGKGWSCFSEPVFAGSNGKVNGMPWLAGWAPGRNSESAPAGYGAYIPAGSALVMEIHYNTLLGKAPDKSYFNLSMVPAAGSGLTPLYSAVYPAPVDLPCPVGSSGPLCSRAASLKDLQKRFGAQEVDFVNWLETSCNHSGQITNNPSSPNATSTSCIWKIGLNETVHRITAHMHLLGKTFAFDDCGTDPTCSSGAVRALTVQNYNFDSQQAYDVTPTALHKGDYVKLTCTYDPTLAQVQSPDEEASSPLHHLGRRLERRNVLGHLAGDVPRGQPSPDHANMALINVATCARSSWSRRSAVAMSSSPDMPGARTSGT
jgi:hypothetical protein